MDHRDLPELIPGWTRIVFDVAPNATSDQIQEIFFQELADYLNSHPMPEASPATKGKVSLLKRMGLT